MHYIPIEAEPESEIFIGSENDLKKTFTIYSSKATDYFDEEKQKDEEYEPIFDVSLRLDRDISLDESDEEEEDGGEEEEDHQFCQQSVIELGYGIKRVRSNDEIGTLLQDHPALVFTNNLLELAATKVHHKCKINGYTEDVQVSLDTVSSAVYLKWGMCVWTVLDTAQYCTYTFLEHDTNKILCINRMTGGKSAALEKACFHKQLQFLPRQDMKVVEIVTDAHMQIETLIGKDYPQIKHSFVICMVPRILERR